MIVGWDGEQPDTFRARKDQPDELCINVLRWSDQLGGTNLVILIWWAVEGIPIPDVKEIPIVCEFQDVFLEELPRLPRRWEVEFTIELVPDIQYISRAPYRMALTELVELKK